MKKGTIVIEKGQFDIEKAKANAQDNQVRYREVNTTSSELSDYDDGDEVWCKCTGKCIEAPVLGNKNEVNLFLLAETEKGGTIRFRADNTILNKLSAGTEVIVLKGSINGGQAFATFKELAGTDDAAKAKVNVDDAAKTV